MRSAILFLILLAASACAQMQREPNHIPFENINTNDTGTYTKTFGSGITLNLGSLAGYVPPASTTGDLVLAAGYDLTTTAGDGELNLNFTLSNASGTLIDIAPAYTGGAADTRVVSLFDVAAFAPTNAAGTDTVSYFTFGAFTDPGATITSEFLTLPSGLDNGINFNAMTALNLGSAGTDFTTTTNVIGTTAGIDVTVGNATGILDLLSDDFSLNTDDIDISDAGAITGATGIVSSGTAGLATVTVSTGFTSTPALRTGANNGTVPATVTAVEYGDGYNHVTVLTLTGAVFVPTIPANAEGAGALIYTFPAGAYSIESAHMDITSGVMDTATNAADLGLGSVIASGDIAVLSGTPTFEDCLTGQTVANVSSFVSEKTTIPTAGAGTLLFEAGGSHSLYLNVAATWNATVATATATGTVTIRWTFLGN